MSGHSQIFRNDRSGNSGGIMLAVKKNLSTITLKITQGKKNWTKLVDTAR